MSKSQYHGASSKAADFRIRVWLEEKRLEQEARKRAEAEAAAKAAKPTPPSPKP